MTRRERDRRLRREAIERLTDIGAAAERRGREALDRMNDFGEAAARGDAVRRAVMSMDAVPDQLIDEWRRESARQAALRRQRLYARQVRRAELRRRVWQATRTALVALMILVCAYGVVVVLWLLAG